jgi:predicted porin
MKIKTSMAVLIVLSTLSTSVYADDAGLFHASLGNDSSIDMYGTLDAAFGYVNHSQSLNNTLPNQMYPFQAVNKSVTSSQAAFVNGGLSDSRIGAKASIALTDDIKFIANLESGIDITNFRLNDAAKSLANNSSIHGNTNATVAADSSLNGGLFDRAAWAGLSTKYGSITAGTQNSPVKDAIAHYDPVASDSFSPFGESGTIGGGVGSSEASRMHNSIKYAGKYNGFFTNLAYQFGNDISTQYGHSFAASIGYENAYFGLTAAYASTKDAVVAGFGADQGQISLSIYDVDGYVVAARINPISDLTIKGGIESFERKSPADGINSVSTLWGTPVSAVHPGFSNGVSQRYSVPFIGGDYKFTKQIDLSLGYYDYMANNKTNTANTQASTRTLSSVLDYKYNKYFDFYLAATTNSFSGAANVNNMKSIDAYALGARLKF